MVLPVAYYIRKYIPNCNDAQTTSPVESMNSHIKTVTKASSLHKLSRSLLMITNGTDERINVIDNAAKRDLQMTVISSRLSFKDNYHSKCVYLMNQIYDDRKKQCCVMNGLGQWIVWNFDCDK